MKIYTFWVHDMYPYLLSGTATKLDEAAERVQTQEYGLGNWFTPVAVMDEERGQKLRASLDLLSEERDMAIKNLKREYNGKLRALLRRSQISEEIINNILRVP